MPRLELGTWINTGVNWLRDHIAWFFDFVKMLVQGMYDGLEGFLGAPEPLLLAGVFAVIAWWLRGFLPALLVFAGFSLIISIEQWDAAMESLSLVLVSAAISLVIAIPLGIWASRNRAVSALLRPVLDFMQTMPAMVYLIPGIFFFGVGVVPGMVATVVFSMPPAVRMAELGIRQVDKELVEAADAFGTPPRRTLFGVQIPLALPTIMAGVNQTIMLALSMVVIAGMVGGGGLGSTIYDSISSNDLPLGFEGGIAVVILAMYLDRMISALNQRVSALGRRSLAKERATASAGARFLHWKPATSLASVGFLVVGGFAWVPPLMHSDGKQGATVNIGYVNWDEGTSTTYLWKEVLEQRGYKPEVQSYEAGALYAGQARGDIDVQTNSWLPVTHEQYWKKYKKDLEDFGAWYDKTSLEVAVPKYVKGVKSLEDLPAQAGKFKNRMVGIEPGAGETDIYKKQVAPKYGLSGKYKLVTSNTASMLAELDRAYRKHEPIAVTLWSPHWAYDKFDLTKLKDPKGAFGSGDGIHMLGRKGFAKEQPEVANWMKNFHLNEKQLTSLENAVRSAGKGHEQEGVRAWLKKNPGMVDKIAPKGKQQGKPKAAGAERVPAREEDAAPHAAPVA